MNTAIYYLVFLGIITLVKGDVVTIGNTINDVYQKQISTYVNERHAVQIAAHRVDMKRIYAIGKDLADLPLNSSAIRDFMSYDPSTLPYVTYIGYSTDGCAATNNPRISILCYLPTDGSVFDRASCVNNQGYIYNVNDPTIYTPFWAACAYYDNKLGRVPYIEIEFFSKNTCLVSDQMDVDGYWFRGVVGYQYPIDTCISVNKTDSGHVSNFNSLVVSYSSSGAGSTVVTVSSMVSILLMAASMLFASDS